MVKREFEVGDRVTCNFKGLGVVKEISREIGVKYKVDVLFDNGIELNYDMEGKAYNGYKRTLFIIPKRKPTLQQVKNKYKELLDGVEEVKFIANKVNYCVIPIKHEGKNNFIFRMEGYYFDNYINIKYISKKDADMVAREMEEFSQKEI